MNRLIKFELIKLFKKNSFKILVLFILIISFITCYFSYNKLDNTKEEYHLTEILPNDSNIKNYDFYYAISNVYNKEVLNRTKIYNLYHGDSIKLNKVMNNGLLILSFSTIVVIIISSSILGNDINKKSIKELLTKPYKRSKILISKFIASDIIVLIIMLLILISYSAFLMLISHENILSMKDYIIFRDDIIKTTLFNKYLIKFIIFSIPIYFISSFTIFLTTLINNQKIIISINSILFIMSPIILSFFLNIGFIYIIYTFIPYLDLSIFNNIYDIYLININNNIHFNIILGLTMLILYKLIFSLLSVAIFNNRNFY